MSTQSQEDMVDCYQVTQDGIQGVRVTRIQYRKRFNTFVNLENARSTLARYRGRPQHPRVQAPKVGGAA